ncbi:hypothetical protein V6N13_038279 [Hibiscus sabdariffa]|uniref:PGG domain-containing protein n=1 Tax=Hibiscus sabdariffa TaxID=183260 RepID=A0ABR2S351_9ROSI
MAESFNIEVVIPPTVEERASEAARIGDTNALYELILEKPDVLSEIERKEFYDTPLHVAAEAGQTVFAMELMGLKPSLAKKLNQDGWSPLHLALKKGHAETALSMFEFDNDLVRVRGKDGYTPFHLAAPTGDRHVLTTILRDCPRCIHDVTNWNDTVLHLAAKANEVNPYQVLLRSLWRSECSTLQIKNLLDFKNRDGDTVLHIAASNKQPEIVRSLTRYCINLRATNSKNLTAMDILSQAEDQQRSKECLRILRSAQNNRTSRALRHIFDFVSQLAYDARNMSSDKSNALLVVTVLILTATYQAALSPPGGVYQPNSTENDTSATMEIHGIRSTNPLSNKRKSPSAAGASVLSTADFLWFFIPNIAAFNICFVITCFVLISNLTIFVSSTLVVALSLLLSCLLVSAVLVISPNHDSTDFMLYYVYSIACFLVIVMYIIALVVVVRKFISRLSNIRHARQKP